MTTSEFSTALRAIVSKFTWYVDKKHRLRGFNNTPLTDSGICPINAVYFYKTNILRPSNVAGFTGIKYLELPEWFVDTITYVSDYSIKQIPDKKERTMRKWLMKITKPIRLLT